MDICTNPLAFSYSKDGWHPVTALLEEMADSGPVQKLEDSVFYKFYQRYQPANMSHMAELFGSNVTFSPPPAILPWGGFTKKVMSTGGGELKKTSWLCGPLDEESIILNIDRSLNLYNKFKKDGYRPWGIFKSFIEGALLENNQGQKRFVVLHGKHRAAVLSFLGVEKLLVRYAPGSVRIIRESDVDNWFHVRNKRCSKEDALAYFHAYFKLTGTERADKMGLL